MEYQNKTEEWMNRSTSQHLRTYQVWLTVMAQEGRSKENDGIAATHDMDITGGEYGYGRKQS